MSVLNLRRFWIAALVLGCLFVVPAARAQQPAVPAPTRIALIDMREVFDKYTAFQGQMNAIDAEIKAHKQSVEGEQKQWEAKGKELAKFQEGSPERRAMEASILQQMSEAKIRSELKRKDVLQKEAAAYYRAYQQVQSHVAGFCQARGYKLVLRFDKRAIDSKNRASVQSGVNRTVVFHSGLDITDVIIGSLNRQASAPAGRRR